jgi:hypothetical protein
MHKISIKLVASLFAIAAVAGGASAYDRKNYPGAACLASGSTNASVARSGTTGRSFNQSTAELVFVCPAVKDFASIQDGYVYVLDENSASGANVDCWLRSGRPDSTTVQSSSASTGALSPTFTSNGTPTKLTFGSVGAVSEGFYFLRCNVPGTDAQTGEQSGIVTYQIGEAE